MTVADDETVEGDALAAVRGKIAQLVAGLDGAFVERELQARMTLLTLLTRHHVLLLGPPGTAKSLLARAVCGAFEGATYFEYLLTRFTHPDELFGPVSIPGLKEEDYRRLTEGFLPAAHVAFVDEIFKANSAILNSLLSLVNERVFYHGRHRDAVPLIGLVGASNEPPDPEGGLGALYDRFLVRLDVPPVHDDDGFLRVALGEMAPFAPAAADRITLAELDALAAAAPSVAVPEAIREELVGVRAALREAAVEVSDRRWRWAVELLRMAALTSGRDAVGPVDLVLLSYCFGDADDATGAVALRVREAVENLVRPPVHGQLGQAWAALGATDGEQPFQRAVAERLAGLEAVERELAAAELGLDAQRDALIETAERCPWVHGVPARLVAGFIGARRELGRYRRAIDAYRQQLASIDIYGEVMPRAREAQAQTVGRGAIGAGDGRLPPLWVSRPGAPPEHWTPVSVEGVILTGARTMLAGAVQRQLVARRIEAGRPVDERVVWHEEVRCVALDNDALFRLLRPGAEGEAVAGELAPDDAEARGALVALAGWLRGVGIRRLPDPPPLDG